MKNKNKKLYSSFYAHSIAIAIKKLLNYIYYDGEVCLLDKIKILQDSIYIYT